MVLLTLRGEMMKIPIKRIKKEWKERYFYSEVEKCLGKTPGSVIFTINGKKVTATRGDDGKMTVSGLYLAKIIP